MKKPEILFNEDIYKEFLLKEIPDAQKSIWIATADIKDVHIESGQGFVPLITLLSRLVKQRVRIRLLHAKEPGPRFRKHFDEEKSLIDSDYFIRSMCPRVHSKIIIIDDRVAYIGSANLTGAGIGARSPHSRNFETGVLFKDKESIDQIKAEYNKIFSGKYCKNCKLKSDCPDPIDMTV